MPVVAPRPVTPQSILAARLGDLHTRLRAAGGIDAELLAELDDVRELAAGLDPYLGRCTTPESPALARLAERTRAQDWAGRAPASGDAALEQEMLSGHVEGQLLKLLVGVSAARRVLDVGMFTGYSALAMAEALPAGGEVVACEVDPAVAALARESFDATPDGEKIRVHVGPALRTLRELAGGVPFDLVFIDADKAGYTDYLDAILRGGLLTRGGLVCVDNTLMQGQPYLSGPPSANGAAIAAFNRAVAEDPRVEQVLIPLRDGITLIRQV